MRLWILAALPSLLATGTGVGQHYGISTPVTLKTYLKTSNSTYYLQDTATSSAERRICTTNSNGSQNPSLTTNFSDADNVWDSTDLSNQASVDVHNAAQFAFDYFKTVHGLANMDPVHGGPYSYEASADGIDCLWLGVNRQVSTNAIWNPELLRLEFGNGDCDDLSPEINPGIPDGCDDAVDNDCTGYATVCGFSGEHDVACRVGPAPAPARRAGRGSRPRSRQSGSSRRATPK